MNVVLFGATGMVGQGVLRECLLDPHVERVLSIGRSATGQHHAKLREIVRPDLSDLSTLESELVGFDACFFCLGVSSAGMAEESYRRVTYDLTMAAARTLSRLNPQMTFVYVSGAGTDSTGRGRTMWARVKGQTENDLLRLPFRAAYMFRPAGIQPLHGVTSRTMLYRIFYAFTRPLFPLLKALFPRFVTTTERVGRAMIEVARHGPSKAILETDDINRIGALPLVSSARP
ncbi:MAG: NAD-dependent epimerase/dehydratase family protein [Thermoanaerobaculia bacterium]